MEKYNKEKNYISLAEAEKYCSYSQDYLSLRARQGKLKAVKIGRNWLTKKEWVEEYVIRRKNYISLAEAEKYCSYSQDYLSLRARQGKLKAVKIGRNWLTQKEWLRKYIVEFDQFNKKNKSILEGAKKKESYLKKKQILPPENLPVKELVFPSANFLSSLVGRFGFLFVFAILLVIVSGFFNMSVLDKIVGNILDSVETEAVAIKNQIVENEIYLATIGNVLGMFKEYDDWLKDQIIVFGQNIREVSGRFARNVRSFFVVKKETEKEIAVKDSSKKGMVVIPSVGKDEEVEEEIKKSFSDEVRVEPEDETSGVIIPVFREKEGEEYLYILVPIQN